MRLCLLAEPNSEFKAFGDGLSTRVQGEENKEETNEAARLIAGGAEGEWLGGGPGGPDEGGSLDIKEKKREKRGRGRGNRERKKGCDGSSFGCVERCRKGEWKVDGGGKRTRSDVLRHFDKFNFNVMVALVSLCFHS